MRYKNRQKEWQQRCLSVYVRSVIIIVRSRRPTHSGHGGCKPYHELFSGARIFWSRARDRAMRNDDEPMRYCTYDTSDTVMPCSVQLLLALLLLHISSTAEQYLPPPAVYSC